MDIELNRFIPKYPSNRQPVFASRGMVATSQPLAAQAGMEMLSRGGNAVDAAIATAAALTVVEPASCGIGGDAFALVWDGKTLHGYNGSGRAPNRLTPELVREQNYDSMPAEGWLPVTVPGAPATWRDLHRRFGRLPFAELFEPAIYYAEHGYPVSPSSANDWKSAYLKFQTSLSTEDFQRWAETFAPDGKAPSPGEIWRCTGLAKSLALIGATESEAFYRGELAQTIANFTSKAGGLLSGEDLAQHVGTWVDPISASYRGYDVWEIPPNGQGLAALIGLNILEGYDLRQFGRENVESYHLQIEAMKLAYIDAQRFVADPSFAKIPMTALLSKEYAKDRRDLIVERALEPTPGQPGAGDTAYLCTADEDGMMVSFIQSTFSSFGSGMVVPGTGIAFQNRGKGFSLDPSHPNALVPGKRPFHTIIPGFLTKNGKAIGPFGVMGGHMQPQGHLQMIVNTLDFNLNPQACLDAPRWFWNRGKSVRVESGVAKSIVEGLRDRGHEVEVDVDFEPYGRGQIIWRLPSGVYVAGSDGRADGCALGR